MRAIDATSAMEPDMSTPARAYDEGNKAHAIDLLLTAVVQLHPRDMQPTDHVRRLIERAIALLGPHDEWDASQIKQPGWNHVARAFADGAREAKANPDCDDSTILRAADGYAKRVFEDADPRSEMMLRTEAWAKLPNDGGVAHAPR